MDVAGARSYESNEAEALVDWALGYLKGGRWDEAEAALAELGRLLPCRPVCWAGAAMAAAMRGRGEQARWYLAELEAQNPKSPLRRVVRNIIKVRLG
jgi:Flp pilus assembly protein TadD